MGKNRQNRRGNTVIEFTLVGIPIIFVLISVFEISRGMWHYHTLAYASREVARALIVRGINSGTTPNCCRATVDELSRKFADSAVGLVADPAHTASLTFRVLDGTADMTAPKVCAPLTSCYGDTSLWPPNDNLAATGMNVEVVAQFPFRSAIAIFWPGAGRPMGFPTFVLTASSRERIQF
jgi:Flp pilus assembly protein TadG